MPQRVLQAHRQGREALAAEHHPGVGDAGPSEHAIAQKASREFDAYVRAIIAKRRSEPRDDILSVLVQVEDGGERLSEREMLNLLRLLLIAGNETATNLIGNGMLALLTNPDQFAWCSQEVFRCRKLTQPTRRSTGARWSSWFAREGKRRPRKPPEKNS